MQTEADQTTGIGAPLRELTLSALSYLRARLELAGLEGKEAVTRLGGMLLLAALATTLTVVGFLLLCVALVFALARWVGSEHAWIWIAAAVGTLQLIGAWALLHWSVGWLRKPMFPATLEEFRKDDAWLRSTAAKPR